MASHDYSSFAKRMHLTLVQTEAPSIMSLRDIPQKSVIVISFRPEN